MDCDELFPFWLFAVRIIGPLPKFNLPLGSQEFKAIYLSLAMFSMGWGNRKVVTEGSLSGSCSGAKSVETSLRPPEVGWYFGV